MAEGIESSLIQYKLYYVGSIVVNKIFLTALILSAIHVTVI